MNEFPLKALARNIIVNPDDVPTQSAGGIALLPDTTERPNYGAIVAVGPDVTDVQIGDRIMFGKYDGKAVPFEGKVYLQMREFDVMAVVE